MSLLDTVRSELEARPASGGELIQRLLLRRDEAASGRAVLVYAALANLHARGVAEPLVETPQAVVWGLAGRPPPPPPPARPPASFVLPEAQREHLEERLRSATRALPLWTFEELRRALLAVAERRGFEGARPAAAVESALDDLGPPHAVRKVLRRAVGGGRVSMRLPGRGPRALLAPLLTVAIAWLVFTFVLRPYTLPPASISMAPTLVPAADGGDALVLADRTAFLRGDPRRGDVVALAGPGGSGTWVKRVMGLPGETVSLDHGDLMVDGERLVKERALLDRVAVPLFGKEGFDQPGQVPGWRQSEPIDAGFAWPDGRREPRAPPCSDVVLLLRLRAEARPCSFTLLLDEGGGVQHGVLLNDSGYGAGASVEGREIASGPDFRIEPGREVEVWITNADRVFRVERDGREIARAPIRGRGREPRISLFPEGGPFRIGTLAVARDLVHGAVVRAPKMAWTLADDRYFVLGDHSAASLDSREAGPVARADLLGRVFAVVWPPSRIRLVD